ncbi:MAG TPA: GDSL-type esterase/lipase family protein [Verrucomicrobiota bacterium]|nr:GDSL-type esterase/lipase family protein [Verrucomicrobiota bacterium]
MPWPVTAGMGLLGVAAIVAAAPLASRRLRLRIWALAIAWVCIGIVLAGGVSASGARATLGSYLDYYYVALAWIMAAAVFPASRAMPGGESRGWWRLLGLCWAMLGGVMWLGASYLNNHTGAFFMGLLILLALLVLCHFWFRLRMPALLAVNTFILLILGLPLTDLAVRCVSSLRGDLDPRRQSYLYAAAQEDPVAFGRWWNSFITQWRRAEQQFKVPDPDPVLLFRLRPNTRVRMAQSAFVINSRGFRGPEIPAEKGNAYRIVALGESTTFGITLYREQRPWPELLEQLIRERLKPARPVQVINAGVPGYRLDQNLYRFPTEILPLKPDMVISYHGINAFSSLRDAVPFASGASPPAYTRRPLRLLADAEYRLRLMRSHNRRPPKPIPAPATLTDPLATPYAQFYRQLIQLARTNNIRLALANFSMAVNERSAPAIVEFYQAGYPNAPWQIQANLVHSTIVQAAAAQHPEVCFVDTRPQLDGEHDKFIDLVHLAPSGDQQLAESFFQALRPILELDLLRP